MTRHDSLAHKQSLLIAEKVLVKRIWPPIQEALPGISFIFLVLPENRVATASEESELKLVPHRIPPRCLVPFSQKLQEKAGM